MHIRYGAIRMAAQPWLPLFTIECIYYGTDNQILRLPCTSRVLKQKQNRKRKHFAESSIPVTSRLPRRQAAAAAASASFRPSPVQSCGARQSVCVCKCSSFRPLSQSDPAQALRDSGVDSRTELNRRERSQPSNQTRPTWPTVAGAGQGHRHWHWQWQWVRLLLLCSQLNQIEFNSIRMLFIEFCRLWLK